MKSVVRIPAAALMLPHAIAITTSFTLLFHYFSFIPFYDLV